MILVALGSNLNSPWGSPRETVLRAVAELQKQGIRIVGVSTLYETKPMGQPNQPNYVNAVVRVESALPPQALMRALHGIERTAGRKRLKRWGPRTLDLDLLDYHGLRLKGSATSVKPLTLPHPGIALRRFVLEPLLDVAPDWKHPVTRRAARLTLRQLNRLNCN
jgi:2-amino-4-hydroxy-6-hydroxymethyldihydropteridine diphosphokinase